MTTCARSSVERFSNGHCTIRGLPCRMWSCPECAKKLRGRVIAITLAGHPERFLTLTVNPKVGETTDKRAVAVKTAFCGFVRQWKRRNHGKPLSYLAVFEEQVSGEPHLHIALRGCWIDQKEISAYMDEHIGAPIVDIRRVKSQRGVARYMAKYLAKDPRKFEGCKRYFYALDWKSRAQREWEKAQRAESDWRYVESSPWQRAEFYERMGFAVWRLSENEYSTFKPGWGARSPPLSTFSFQRAV